MYNEDNSNNTHLTELGNLSEMIDYMLKTLKLHLKPMKYSINLNCHHHPPFEGPAQFLWIRWPPLLAPLTLW